MTEILHLTGLELDELTAFVEQAGEPKYRAKQLFKGLHERRLRDLDDLTDLPKAFRERLQCVATAATLEVESKYISEDGTRRYLMNTKDGRPVETVFIPSEGRDTICFSSQSGCALKCDFCLTAKLGLLRNLTAGEIVEQIIIVLTTFTASATRRRTGPNLSEWAPVSHS